MTYNQLVDFFNILQDKFGSPYHTADEIELYLNRAQLDLVVALLPVDEGKLNIELGADTINRIAPLIVEYSVNPLTGPIFKEDINDGLSTPYLRLLAASYNGFPAKYVKYNNLFVYLNNIFKVPSATAPRIYEDGDVFIFLPETSAVVKLILLRYPRTISSVGPVTSELPDFIHNEIVARALEFAGVGSRDQMLSELKKLNNA